MDAIRRTVAIDFDGTIAETDFPAIIRPVPEALRFVAECRERGVAVILWTCRTDHQLSAAMEWCKTQGLWFDAVNDNLPEKIAAYSQLFPDVNANGRKIAADLYVDDKAFLDWGKAFEWLRGI